ncbi:uncharacterized protein TNCV_3792841 [Trichonephila clavipes]|nr:uncharacterized protein TNCV_3792841 [Trichonephila clavipes]
MIGTVKKINWYNLSSNNYWRSAKNCFPTPIPSSSILFGSLAMSKLDEIAYLLREISENESVDGELSCSNLDSEEDVRLSESDCEESEESADVIDNIPVNPDMYVARDSRDWILHNNVSGRFETQNFLQQSSVPTSFMKHNVISFL